MRTMLAGFVVSAALGGAALAQPAPAAPEAPAAPAPAAETPTLPTSGDAAQVIQALEKVCVPAVRGQGLDAAAKAAGLRQNRREGTWSLPLSSGRDYVILFQPQFSQTDVCEAEVRFAIGQDAPIVSALNIWAFLQEPKLVMLANYVAVDADGVKRARRSWEGPGASGGVRGLNFSTQRKPDDTPLSPKFDSARLFYQERK